MLQSTCSRQAHRSEGKENRNVKLRILEAKSVTEDAGSDVDTLAEQGVEVGVR